MFTVLLLVASGGPSLASERVALVIGNSNYAKVPFLPNAVRDAQDVSAALRELGFAVHDGYDLTRSETLRLAARVTAGLRSDDVAVFYFSGHGIQIGAENFIIPVDADGDDAESLKSASVSLQSVLREMELRSQRNIIILDACRNNPFQTRMAAGRAVGGTARGLARVDAGVGSYIAFSTQPGNVALDGSGRNSPFTAALLRHVNSTDDDLHELMRKVRADVVSRTGGTQVPWENSSMIEQVFLSRPDGRAAPAKRAEPREDGGTTPAQPQFTHAVSGLDPNGDGFLALRAGTTSAARRLSTMSEGTRLQVLGQDGVWFHVRTRDGREGWAHSNWIRFTGAVPPSSGTKSVADRCEELWLRRNAYFDKYGYCFRSARGQAAFPNAGCNPSMTADSAPLTRAERAEVTRLLAAEKSLGCR